MSTTRPDVSIIIVTHNSLPLITTCLDGLRDNIQRVSAEIIVVDNDSTDGTAGEIRDHETEPVMLEQRTNLGFAAGCNVGARHARGHYLLFLNPDVAIDRGAVDLMVDFLRTRDDAGVVTARLRNPNRSFQPNCRRFPTVRNMVFSRGSWLARLLGQSGVYTYGDAAEPLPVDAVAGTMAMVSSDLFSRVGGFDERFFLYMEDTDLCRRVAGAGFTNYFLPQAGAQHAWAQGSDTSYLRRHFYHHRSVWKYFRKHFPGLPSMIMLAVMLTVNLLVVSATGRRKTGK